MNALQRLPVICSFLVFLVFSNVLCFRGNNGYNSSSSLYNGSQFIEQLNNSFTSAFLESQSMNKIGDDLAETISNELVSVLQRNAPTFLESSFDIKSEVKKHAKQMLKELIKVGLPSVEKLVAENIKPPKVDPGTYGIVAPVLTSLFNKVETAVGTNVSDDIWNYNSPDVSESEESLSDDFFD
ncbi:cell traversal protein for ookinetes and sporozoites [Plasmodium gaboni]|uniref:Cell traversal protein for ookinetes and sporozoites n=1 Tax=Plasmodium gaboni TaxID=647221 RepID=A0A151LGH5_9APIC|nr:cell traversal protein for ookinetes and sporozoites [Plasmodium gaboni]KYN97977.1 cell traversal protein for ookinetes and sporozoites [Plasmodium gaboni]SOV16301.1 cell traversal protein for ookinetes and sporozoites [Plasmodium gaboni]